MHEDEAATSPAPDDTVIVDLERGEIAVTDRHGGRQRVPMDEHRPAVVRRLLARGLTPTILRRLLPELRPVIDLVAAEETAPSSLV